MATSLLCRTSTGGGCCSRLLASVSYFCCSLCPAAAATTCKNAARFRLWLAHPTYCMLKLSSAGIRELIGAAICLAAVGVAVLIWRGSPDPPTVLPLVFLVIVVWLAIQFGRHAGFVSTLIASGALAFFIYKPVAKFAIDDHTAAGYVAALLLGGLICSELLADPRDDHQHFRR